MPMHLAVIMINVFWSIQALRAEDNYVAACSPVYAPTLMSLAR